MSSIAEKAIGPVTLTSARARKERVKQAVAFGLLGAVSLSIVVPAVLIVYFVTARGLHGITWEFLTSAPRNGMTAGGIWPAILGSTYLVILTLILAVPAGVLGAVYLTEYARQGPLVRLIRLAILNLAGVPSIVYGLFGMGVFVMVIMPAVLNLVGADSRAASPSCLLAGAATLALLVLPMVITTTEEALRQIPQHQRNASLALGATRWQTISKVVLPAAIPGIITGIMLSVGRIISETAVFYVTLGGSYRLPKNLFSGGRTLSLHLFYLAMDTNAFEKAMGTGAVLIVSIILINLIIDLISRKLSAGVRLHQ